MVGSVAAAQDTPVTLSASSTATTVRPGRSFEVTLVAKIAEGWHLYSMTQPPPPIATVIELAPSQPYELDGEIGGPAPVLDVDPSSGEMVEFYDGDASFTVPVKAAARATAGAAPVRVRFRYQACNDSICLRPTTLLVEVPIEVVAGR